MLGAGDVTPFGTVSKAWRTGSKPVVSVRTALGYEVANGRAQGSNRWRKLGRASKTVGKPIALARTRFLDGEDFEVRYEIAPCCNAHQDYRGHGASSACSLETTATTKTRAVDHYCDGADVDAIERLAGFAYALVFSLRRVLSARRAEGVEVRFSRVRLTEVLDAIGLLRRTKPGGMKRKVSPCLSAFGSPARVVREFLRGLFEVDGFASRCGNTVKMFSKHKEFVRDVQRLLLAFGITCRVIRIDKVTNGYSYVGYNCLFTRTSLRFTKSALVSISAKTVAPCLAAPGLRRRGVSVTYFDEVVSVVDDGESDVHDMTVPGESRFDGRDRCSNCASEGFISRTEDPFIPVVLVMEAINNTYREVPWPADRWR